MSILTSYWFMAAMMAPLVFFLLFQNLIFRFIDWLAYSVAELLLGIPAFRRWRDDMDIRDLAEGLKSGEVTMHAVHRDPVTGEMVRGPAISLAPNPEQAKEANQEVNTEVTDAEQQPDNGSLPRASEGHSGDGCPGVEARGAEGAVRDGGDSRASDAGELRGEG